MNVFSISQIFQILKILNKNKEDNLQYWQQGLLKINVSACHQSDETLTIQLIFHGPLPVLLCYFAVLPGRYFLTCSYLWGYIPPLEIMKAIWIGWNQRAVELLVLTCNDVNPVCLNTAYLNDDSPKAALSCFFYYNHDFQQIITVCHQISQFQFPLVFNILVSS